MSRLLLPCVFQRRALSGALKLMLALTQVRIEACEHAKHMTKHPREGALVSIGCLVVPSGGYTLLGSRPNTCKLRMLRAGQLLQVAIGMTGTPLVFQAPLLIESVVCPIRE